MGVIIRRLQEGDIVENFDCKDELLNNYLKKHAWANQQKISIGVTYVVVDESAPTVVLDYFTLPRRRSRAILFPKNMCPAYWPMLCPSFFLRVWPSINLELRPTARNEVLGDDD